jgi:hypothetical protein
MRNTDTGSWAACPPLSFAWLSVFPPPSNARAYELSDSVRAERLCMFRRHPSR